MVIEYLEDVASRARPTPDGTAPELLTSQDLWFGEEALQGPVFYNTRITSYFLDRDLC